MIYQNSLSFLIQLLHLVFNAISWCVGISITSIGSNSNQSSLSWVVGLTTEQRHLITHKADLFFALDSSLATAWATLLSQSLGIWLVNFEFFMLLVPKRDFLPDRCSPWFLLWLHSPGFIPNSIEAVTFHHDKIQLAIQLGQANDFNHPSDSPNYFSHTIHNNLTHV